MALGLTTSAAAAGPPLAPDYATADAWAAYPGTAGHADDAPPGLSATHTTGTPVFFVHPTLRERRHFRDALSAFGIYHDFDYGLFYANIRENALLRVRAWKGGHATGP